MTPYEYFLQTFQTRRLVLRDEELSFDKEAIASGIESISEALESLNLPPGSRVGVSVGKSLQILAALAVWKNDLVIVLLSFSNPQKRISDLEEQSDLKAAIVGDGTPFSFKCPTIKVTSLNLKGKKLKAPRPNKNTESYIIFTSGTTGTPKGVVISNTALVAFFEAIRSEKRFGLDDDSQTFFQMTDFGVDIFFWDFVMWIMYGGELEVFVFQSNVVALLNRVSECKVTFLTVPAPILGIFTSVPKLFQKIDLSHLRILSSAASALTPGVARDVLKLFPQVRLFNCYGPTEATVFSSWSLVTNETIDMNKSLDLGNPIGRMSYAFLENETVTELSELPDQSVGELLMKGPQLFDGYLSAPELTREKTLLFGKELFYRTGDLVIYDAGLVRYLGRMDDTVKLNGHRINLFEIEKVALTSNLLTETSALLWEPSPDYFKLVLFGLLKDPESEKEAPKKIRQVFEEELPKWMMPSEIFFLTDFPRNRAKKVDRLALRGLVPGLVSP